MSSIPQLSQDQLATRVFKNYIGTCTLKLGNVEHCRGSVSKQCTMALNCYVAKALPVKYQITGHTAWHRPIAKTKFVTINSIITLAEKACHGVIPHNGAIFLPLRSYSGC